MQLQAENISFAYIPNRQVLKDLTFSISDNEVLGIVGSSGCGKSTLLRILCGILNKVNSPFLKGHVSINGETNLYPLRRNGQIGFMFQNPGLLPNLSVSKNIGLPLTMNEVDPSYTGYINDLLQMVGLNDFSNYLPHELSGGMQTRVALARTFVTRPNLLLLDEPFSSLDYAWKMDLYQKLFKLIKRYRSTVVLVSHDIEEIFLFSNSILLLSKGGRIEYKYENGEGLTEEVSSQSVKEFLETRSEVITLFKEKLLFGKQQLAL